MEPFLCFVHIERAGGTTLHHVLRHAYPRYHTVFPWYYWANEPEHAYFPDELAGLMKVLPGCQGIGGHTTRPWLDYGSVAGREVFWLTFLRDPIKRYLSHYNHQVQKMDIRWEVDDFLAESRFDDFQTVRLAGRPDLDEAKRVLSEQMGFVGLTDRFDASLVLMQRALGRAEPLFYEHRNATPEPGQALRFDALTPAQQERVRQNNALDCQLHAWVVEELWPRQVARLCPDLDVAVVDFRRQNKGFRYPRLRSTALRVLHGGLTRLVEPVLHQARGIRPPPRR